MEINKQINSFLYVGQYSDGTTSKMRADELIGLLQPTSYKIIDTHKPFFDTPGIIRSFGFRFKKGPLIRNINAFISKNIGANTYDMIWVDKAVFITEETILSLRERTSHLIHFTPDPAFTFHKSELFNKSIQHFDFAVTTKSYELKDYYSRIDGSKVILTTQGFDPSLHKKSHRPFKSKKGLVFIGHYEKERALILGQLIRSGIEVSIAGIKWDQFCKANRKYNNLHYYGTGLYGNDYVETIQNARIAWGAISKWVPELHTTRTFEIPACGTALLTEANSETKLFFDEDEVIFYCSHDELYEKTKYFLEHTDELEAITRKGHQKVVTAGYDYQSILLNVLKKVIS